MSGDAARQNPRSATTAAWRLTCLGQFTLDQITAASGVSRRTVSNMRVTVRYLKSLGWNIGRMSDLTWAEARANRPHSRPVRKPVVERDRYGNEVFVVTLGGGKGFARVDRDDYWALMARGVSPNWFRSGGKKVNRPVAARLPGPAYPTLVARLIMNPAPNQHVTFRDGDPLNLRRSNLALVNNRKDTMNV